MTTILPFVMYLAMIGTVAVLVVGLVGFARGGAFYQKHANNLMRARVIGQAIALLIFAILMLTLGSK